MLRRVASKNDAIGQNAYLYLGQAYFALGNKTNARLAFELAAQCSFDKATEEAALYNYALLVRDTYSAFGESVAALELFLSRFPASHYAEKIKEYLAQEYVNTTHYAAALASIEKIASPTKSILCAKQIVLVRLGADHYVAGDYERARNTFDGAVTLGEQDAAAYASAYLWRAEIAIKQGMLAAAKRDYRECLARSSRTTDQAMAHYGMGYLLFNNKEYETALSHYNSYLKLAVGDARLAADVRSRKGDCLYRLRRLDEARESYQHVVNAQQGDEDYALVQLAKIEGVDGRYPVKVKMLQRLLTEAPESPLADYALYEMGRTYLLMEDNKGARTAFQKLFKEYPSSSYAPKAGAQIALIYYNENDAQGAIAAYKELIKQYPGTDQANVALEDLRNIYVEQNRVNEYVVFANSLGGSNKVEVRTQDSLTYAAAERFIMVGESKKALPALDGYLKAFPKGIFAVPAEFNRGKIYYNQKQRDKAIASLAVVIASGQPLYQEEAYTMQAAALFALERYDEACVSYENLYDVAKSKPIKRDALLGMVRSAYRGEEYAKVIAQTAEMDDDVLDLNSRREVLYLKAKSQLIMRDKGAEPTLQELSADLRSAEGAEAKYLIAQYYYDYGLFDKARKVVEEYIAKGTPHAYWLARSFVLLADIYLQQEDPFTAKQYLESLMTNYNGADDIAAMAQERLAMAEQQLNVTQPAQ